MDRRSLPVLNVFFSPFLFRHSKTVKVTNAGPLCGIFVLLKTVFTFKSKKKEKFTPFYC